MPSLGRSFVCSPIAVLVFGVAVAAEPAATSRASADQVKTAAAGQSGPGQTSAGAAASHAEKPAAAALGATQPPYAGVSPDSKNRNPLDAPKGPPSMLVWTGFEKTASGSRVFLQTSGEVQYSTAEKGKRILVTLQNCRIHLKNNQRTLDTRFFPATPVRKVAVKQRGRNVEVDIDLRTDVNPTTTRETGPESTQFLMLNFPGIDPSARAEEGGQPATDDRTDDGTKANKK